MCVTAFETRNELVNYCKFLFGGSVFISAAGSESTGTLITDLTTPSNTTMWSGLDS